MIENKTVLITGSTDGVGRHVAIELGRRGAHVLVHGRDRARGEAVCEDILRAGAAATFLRADFSSLDDVRSLANAVHVNPGRLDLLINNAGIGTLSGGPQRRTSADGYELRFAVNYLAPFLLTRLLLPLLRASAPARIINVASGAQMPVDFDDVMLSHGYTGDRAYSQSKLALIMFTLDLTDELQGSGVTANCLHPATYMNTTMVREAGVTPASSIEEGADAILRLAASPELEGRTGLYFNRQREARAHSQAYDQAARQRLRKLSLRLTGLAAD